MRVIVAGAGIGGLTTALTLHARGLRPLLLERESGPGAGAGAGLQLGPNAVRVLDALGLGEGLRRIGASPAAAEVRRGRDGRLLLSTPFGEAERRWGAPYLQVLRADLQALLREAVDARDAAEVRTGAAVAGVDPSGAVRLADGGALQAEVVVAADGLRSAVAAAVDGADASPPRALRRHAWRALIPSERLPPDLRAPLTRVLVGARGHLVAYPLRGGAFLNLVAVTGGAAGGEEGWTAPGDPAALRATFAGWADPAPILLAALERDAVWRGALYDRPPRRRWTAGRVALLGDAAHPMSPSFAQGAGMAIEDAWALAHALAGIDGAGVERALQRYAAARRPRTARVQAQSRRNGALFHLPDAISTPLFTAAALAGRLDGSAGLARFDWLYGGGPIPAP